MKKKAGDAAAAEAAVTRHIQYNKQLIEQKFLSQAEPD